MNKHITIYLDQWCWNLIADDSAGQRSGHPDEGIYEHLKSLVHRGRVRLPLSIVHYTELWERKELKYREPIAKVMAELSNFLTISNIGLSEWESRKALKESFGLGYEAIPDVFGNGILHIAYKSSIDVLIPRIGQALTQGRIDLAAFTASMRKFEYAVLAQDMSGLSTEEAELSREIPELLLKSKFLQAQNDYEQIVRDEVAIHEDIAFALRFKVYNDRTTRLHMLTQSKDLGIETQEMQNWYDSMTSREPIDELLKQMPISNLFAGMRAEAYRNPSYLHKKSDLGDFFAIATVAPFVDHIVLDKTSRCFYESFLKTDQALEMYTHECLSLQDLLLIN